MVRAKLVEGGPGSGRRPGVQVGTFLRHPDARTAMKVEQIDERGVHVSNGAIGAMIPHERVGEWTLVTKKDEIAKQQKVYDFYKGGSAVRFGGRG